MGQKYDDRDKFERSLKDCYANLKELLGHYIEEKEFMIVCDIYKLLSDVAWHAQDYIRAIKYLGQAVKRRAKFIIGIYQQSL